MAIGTVISLAEKKRKKLEEEEAAKKAKEEVITPPTPAPTQAAPTKTTQPEIIRDEKGRVTGVSLPDGRTFLGVGKEEALGLAENWLQKQQIPAGAVEAKVGAETRQQQELGAQLAQQTGQLSPEILAQIERGEIDIGQVLGGGLAGAAPGVAAGAVGAGIAAATGVGAVAAPFIIAAGGVAGFITGARSNLKSQKAGKVQAGSGGLTDGEKNLRKFVTAANKDPSNAAEYNRMFNEQLSYIERDWGILQLDSSGFLKDLSGVDATPQRADYQRFYDTTRPFLITQMQMAMLNPNPNKNFLTMEEMGEI